MELKINVPSTLNEIPLKHYQEFLKVQEGSTDEEFIAQKMIEIFCGISLSDVVNIKLKSLNELIVHFTKLFEQKTSFQQTFKIKNVEFGFIPELEEISFGEYVDLESHLTSWDNYHKAMAVMYRPITKKDKKNRYDIREYKPNPDMQELMRFAPLDVCLASTVFFLQFRKRLTSGYTELFGEADNDEQGGINDFSETTQFSKRWGWYQSLYGLAKGDITKFDEVAKYRLTKCLTYLTFEKQKNEIEQRHFDKQMKR